MQKILILTLLLVVSACSKKTTIHNPEIISNEKLSFLDISGDPDFGSVEAKKTALKTFFIKNESSSNMTLTPQIESNPLFTITYHNCIEVKKENSCIIKVALKTNPNNVGNFSYNLNFNENLSVPLTVNVFNLNSITGYDIIYNNQSISNLDFGLINNLFYIQKNITITNKDIANPTRINPTLENNNEIKIMFNSCSNRLLRIGEKCLIKLAAIPIASSTGSVSNKLIFENKELSLTTSFNIPSKLISSGLEDLQVFENSSEAKVAFDLGILQKGHNKIIKNLVIKNKGTGTAGLFNLNLDNSKYKILYSSCNTPVMPGTSCIIKLIINGADLNVGDELANLSIGTKNISLKTRVVNPDTQPPVINNKSMTGPNKYNDIFYTSSINPLGSLIIPSIDVSDENATTVKYSLSGSCDNEVDTINLLTLPENQNSKVYFRVIDDAGYSSNCEEIASITHDNTIPTISYNQVQDVNYFNPLNQASQIHNFDASVFDNNIKNISYYKFYGENCSGPHEVVPSLSVDIPRNQKVSVKIIVEDLAGNLLEKCSKFAFLDEATNPQIIQKNMIANFEFDNKIYSNQDNLSDITSTIQTTSYQSNPVSVKYSLNSDCSNSTTKELISLTLNSNNNVYAQAEDLNTGLKSPCEFVKSVVHDNINPNVNFVLESNHRIKNPNNINNSAFSFTNTVLDLNPNLNTYFLYRNEMCQGIGEIVQNIDNISINKNEYSSVKITSYDKAGNSTTLCSPSVILENPGIPMVLSKNASSSKEYDGIIYTNQPNLNQDFNPLITTSSYENNPVTTNYSLNSNCSPSGPLSSITLNLNANNNIYIQITDNNTGLKSSCELLKTVVNDTVLPINAVSSQIIDQYITSTNSLPQGEIVFSSISNANSIDSNYLKTEFAIGTSSGSNNLINWTNIIPTISNNKIVFSPSTTHPAISNYTYSYITMKITDKAGNEQNYPINQRYLISNGLKNSCEAIYLEDGTKNSDTYFIDIDGSSSAYIPTKVLCDKNSKNKTFFTLKPDSTNYILDNGGTLTDNLYSFAAKATTNPNSKQFSGVFNLKHNSTVIETQLIEYAGGTYNDLSFCDAIADSRMCMVRFNGNTTLSGFNSPAVRKKGLVIYVDGDLTINSGASISMTQRGAIASGQNLSLISTYTVPAAGASGGTGVLIGDGRHAFDITGGQYTNHSMFNPTQGADGSNGQTGGGSAGGGINFNGYSAKGGNGAAGTSYSGGSGGGGSNSRSCNGRGGDAAPNGGAGGYADGCWDWDAGSGVGNPSGGRKDGDTAYEKIALNSGTGGLLILYVNGNIINNGSIQSNGTAPGTSNGGSSGGGSVNVFRTGNYSGAGTITATGGDAATRRAGHGTARNIQLGF